MPSFKSNLDIQQNQLLNAVLQRLLVRPDHPVEGQLYYDDGKHLAYLWDGSYWIPWGTSSGSGSGDIKQFTLNIPNPAIGSSMLMVRLFEDLLAVRVDAHFSSDATVFFNIDCRQYVNEPGSTLCTRNMQATLNGNEYSTIDRPYLKKDYWLCLTIDSDAGDIPPEGEVTGTGEGTTGTGEGGTATEPPPEGGFSGVLTVVLTCSAG
jgi:hypothetical protein